MTTRIAMFLRWLRFKVRAFYRNTSSQIGNILLFKVLVFIAYCLLNVSAIKSSVILLKVKCLKLLIRLPLPTSLRYHILSRIMHIQV